MLTAHNIALAYLAVAAGSLALGHALGYVLHRYGTWRLERNEVAQVLAGRQSC